MDKPGDTIPEQSGATTFQALGFNRYGEDPSLGGSQRGRSSSQPRTFEARVENIFNDLMGKTFIQFETIRLDNENGSRPKRAD